MADTLTLRIDAALTEGSVDKVWREDPEVISVSVTGTKRLRNWQGIGLAAETLALGEVTLGGYLIAKNLSSTTGEIIHLMTSAGVKFATLKPGETSILRLAATLTALQANADAGTPRLEYWLIDN